MSKRSRTTAPSRRSKEARALRALPHRVIPNKKRCVRRVRFDELGREVTTWTEEEDDDG
jgi:hypothetical protein